MTEKVVEEYNLFTRALTSVEGSLLALIFFWLVLALLRGFDKLSEQYFFELFLTSGIIYPLIRKITE